MKDEATQSAIVVDIGTARTKVTVATQKGSSVEFKASSIDESIAAAWQECGRPGLERSIEAIRTYAASVGERTHGAKVCVIGAHLFRGESYSSELLQIANDAFGSVNVLSTELEAALFFRSVAEGEESNKAIVALDVGGGSVQLVWGTESSSFLSAPLGTYSIQDRFQKSLEDSISSDSDEWKLAYRAVYEAFAPAREIGSLTSSKLVVGSNIMEDFFAAAFSEGGLEGLSSGSYSRQNVSELCRLIGGNPYGELARFFPSSPGFMYGADKLLIAVSAIMDILRASEVCGTNLSVSKGAALLAVQAPGELEALGVKCR